VEFLTFGERGEPWREKLPSKQTDPVDAGRPAGTPRFSVALMDPAYPNIILLVFSDLCTVPTKNLKGRPPSFWRPGSIWAPVVPVLALLWTNCLI
jgi:hypothetical protein